VSGAAPSIEILYLTHNYPRFAGDFAGSFIARLAEKVSASGRPVGVLAPHHRDAVLDEVIGGVRVWRFRYGSDERETLAYQGDLGKIQMTGRRGVMAHYRFMRSFAQAAQSVTAAETPRIIHAQWWIPAGIIARKLRFSGQVIVTLHGTDMRLLRAKRWLRPLAQRVFERASVITVVSSWLGSTLSGMFPRIEDKLRVIPMPPNDDVFRREESRPPGDHLPLILSVTRFTTQKRNNVLVEALALLRDQGVAFRARLIGDGPLRPEIRRMIESADLGDRVALHEPVSQSELAAEYRGADVVVLPSVEEGFGMALVEAQMCGTAVVGVRSGGLCDIVEDGVSGLLAAPDEVSDLAQSLQRLLSDVSFRTRIADAGWRSANENFSTAAIVRKFCQWYNAGGGT